MKKVRSSVQPQPIEFVGNSVLVATNVTTYEEEVDGRILSGYEYDCQEYSKDQYMLLQDEKIASLGQELAAAKILLGVD